MILINHLENEKLENYPKSDKTRTLSSMSSVSFWLNI